MPDRPTGGAESGGARAAAGDGAAGAAAIDREGVLRIAHLARLRLDDDEAVLFAGQLNDILAHAQEIADAEARAGSDGVGPGARDRAAATLRLRAGEAAPDPLLAGPEAFAPEFVEGLFAVPRLAAMEEEPAP